ncbi:AraC family transcriptional regulator [Galbibacter marinus]|uniref:AraC family transcriptional regulator n=1 Tax=Galbibacter marinus TaxID=555500 RepID=K2PPQ4_9FLAO|nr:AraC family transcriptional regulator [Galbibacter marinus]
MNYIIGKIEKNKRYRTVKINYLADECGFRDVHTFIRSFKIRTGEVPTKYIQNLSSENSEEA